LNSLGDVIDQLERDWEVIVGATLYGGSESYVAAAKTREGTEGVIKIAIPGNALSNEAQTLLLADGHGYVRLLEHDEARQAMLQERLGRSLADLNLPVKRQIEIICATLHRAWEVPANPSLQSGADKARWLGAFIAATWDELNKPCSERVIEQALSFADIRCAAFNPETTVLVHGDAHSGNTLQDPMQRASANTHFKFIDPDGLLAERAYDLAIPMREWSSALLEGDATRLGRERCAYLGHLTGVNTRAIWEWGFIERVSTGLLAMRVGAERVGKEMLDVAHQWVTTVVP